MNFDGNEVLADELLRLFVGIYLGIQPGATCSGRRGAEVQKKHFAARPGLFHPQVGVTNPLNFRHVEPSYTRRVFNIRTGKCQIESWLAHGPGKVMISSEIGDRHHYSPPQIARGPRQSSERKVPVTSFAAECVLHARLCLGRAGWRPHDLMLRRRPERPNLLLSSPCSMPHRYRGVSGSVTIERQSSWATWGSPRF